MMLANVVTFMQICVLLTRVSGHSGEFYFPRHRLQSSKNIVLAIFHPSMFGFNVTQQTFPYDNRPVAPLRNFTFDKWWFHGHLRFPPHPEDIFNLPAGQPATAEIACDKGATSFFNSSQGGNIIDPKNPDYPCPGAPTVAFHTHGLNDTEGCALGIAYESEVDKVEPEDFVIFSVNQTCVWTRFTDFQVPERMPPCPEGGCICAFFWVHAVCISPFL